MYSGGKNMYTVNVLKKDRMKRCLRYAVCGLTGRSSFLALAIQPYEQVFKAIMVEKLLETVMARGMSFLTPYKINERTDELYKESVLDGEVVKDYSMRSRTGW
ncbi:hypothetical protein [Methanocella conradii]|uniref:hypothetical protein n=1 Tax=Methanocella conradii TaxID=1175444 RepID=UPI0024B3B8FA|nr:hypothetical protein [Methanocella conradii]MDI6896870.1 hypothetical protein [Methanocella conradii]